MRLKWNGALGGRRRGEGRSVVEKKGRGRREDPPPSPLSVRLVGSNDGRA